MKPILTWTLDTIREEDSSFSWMEECRYDWVPVVQTAVNKILEGKTILLLTDDKRAWYAKYVASKINNLQNERPFLPVYTLKSMFPNIARMKNTQDLDLLEDMLEISYPNGYFIWYIGSAESSYSKFAFRNLPIRSSAVAKEKETLAADKVRGVVPRNHSHSRKILPGPRIHSHSDSP